MAANPKKLRVVDARMLGPRTRALAIECVEGGPFDAAGGKYVIVHTGAFAGERPIKRAYSLVPREREPGIFEMIVQRRDGGPGSAALHDAPVATELAFSGPWGKLVPEGGLPPRTLFVATDTGITSALGLVEQHRPEAADVLWLRAEDDDFIPVDSVRARVEAAGARFSAALVPPAADPARAPAAWALLEGRLAERAASLVVATGDGRVVHPLPSRLAGVETRVECYFHNPEKKSAS